MNHEADLIRPRLRTPRAAIVGICFLWFVGVLRDRMGKLEDRFLPPFSSVARCCSWP